MTESSPADRHDVAPLGGDTSPAPADDDRADGAVGPVVPPPDTEPDA